MNDPYCARSPASCEPPNIRLFPCGEVFVTTLLVWILGATVEDVTPDKAFFKPSEPFACHGTISFQGPITNRCLPSVVGIRL